MFMLASEALARREHSLNGGEGDNRKKYSAFSPPSEPLSEGPGKCWNRPIAVTVSHPGKDTFYTFCKLSALIHKRLHQKQLSPDTFSSLYWIDILLFICSVIEKTKVITISMTVIGDRGAGNNKSRPCLSTFPQRLKSITLLKKA